MKKRTVNILKLMLILLLACECLSIPSCILKRYDVVSLDNRQLINIYRGVSRFSFEFPALYKVEKVDFDKDETRIDIHGLIRENEYFKVIYHISVIKHDGERSSADRIEYDIDFLNGILEANREFNITEPNTKIIDRSFVEVAGLSGEQLTYHFTRYKNNSWAYPYCTTNHHVYFNDSEYIWGIWMEYEPTSDDLSAQYEADFEHLLQSFKILD